MVYYSHHLAVLYNPLYGCLNQKLGGGWETPQIIHLFVGFGTIFFSPSILGGFPTIFGNSHIHPHLVAGWATHLNNMRKSISDNFLFTEKNM